MRKALSLTLACLLVLTGVFSACAEERPEGPVPTAEPRYEPGPDDIIITEEDGGEFRPLPIDVSPGAPLKVNYKGGMHIYQDPTIRVERHKLYSNYWKVNIFYAYVEIRDPSQIRTAPAKDFSTTGLMPANLIAKHNNAVLAVNGDYYAAFSGNKANNYVFRQGTLYRNTVATDLDMLLIDEDGDFHILPAGEGLLTIDKTQIDGKKVINALQFGPALVIDGEKVPDERILDATRAPTYTDPGKRAQRMCIAQIDHLHYLVVTCRNYGIDLLAFRDLVMTLADCKVVYNLDGGASSQMVFFNRKYNANANEDEQRNITDIIYFASAWFK